MLAYIYIYHTWILCIWPRIQEIERERGSWRSWQTIIALEQSMGKDTQGPQIKLVHHRKSMKHASCWFVRSKAQDMLKPWNSIDSFPRGPGPFKKIGANDSKKANTLVWAAQPPAAEGLWGWQGRNCRMAEVDMGFTMFHFCLFILFYVLSQFGRKFQNTEPWFEMSISLHQPYIWIWANANSLYFSFLADIANKCREGPRKKECLRRISHTKFQRCMLKRHLSQICLASLCWSSAKSLGVFPARCLPQNYHQQSSTSLKSHKCLEYQEQLEKGLTPLSIWLKLTAKCCCWFTYTLTCWYLQGGTPS